MQRFDASNRVPQIGWNTSRSAASTPSPSEFPNGGHCYFVNSYYAAPADPAHVLGETDVRRRVLLDRRERATSIATQFHAEKSGELGLAILAAFAEWDGTC